MKPPQNSDPSTGAKTRTFVYAAGSVLAWQQFAGAFEEVLWENRDPSNASFRMTDLGGSPWGSTDEAEPAELDPTGANAGIHAPLITDPPPEGGGSLVPYPRFSDPSHPGTSYSVDGMPVPVEYFFSRLDSAFHGSFGLAEASARASRPRLRNYEVTMYNGRLTRDFGLNLHAAMTEALEGGGTLIRNWIVSDWSFAYTLPPQNPGQQPGTITGTVSDPQNTGIKAGLNEKDAKRYENERLGALGRLAFSPGCREFLANHGIDVKGLIDAVRNQRPYDGTKSTITRANAGVVDTSNPVDVRYGNLEVRSSFGSGSGTSAETGIYPGGSLGATVSDRSDVYFRRAGINSATILHEALHSLLGDNDTQLQQRLGLSTSDISGNITQALRNAGCAE